MLLTWGQLTKSTWGWLIRALLPSHVLFLFFAVPRFTKKQRILAHEMHRPPLRHDLSIKAKRRYGCCVAILSSLSTPAACWVHWLGWSTSVSSMTGVGVVFTWDFTRLDRTDREPRTLPLSILTLPSTQRDKKPPGRRLQVWKISHERVARPVCC